MLRPIPGAPEDAPNPDFPVASPQRQRALSQPLELSQPNDIEASVASLIALARSSRGKMWQVGDAYIALCDEFGQRVIDQRLRDAQINLLSVRTYAVACRHFAERLRYLNRCDPSHYQAASVLPVDSAMELLRRADRDGWSVSRIRWEARRIKTDLRQQGNDIVRDIAGMQKKKFRVILIDPPWKLWPTQTKRGGSGSHYDHMEIDAIRALRFADIADPRCFLFLWMPATSLPWMNSVLDAWGFTFAAQRIWRKEGGIGMGEYVRYDFEDLVIGKAEKAPGHFLERVAATFSAPRGKHSEKPAIVHEYIERACRGPYCELFARQRRKGWTQFGNQLPLAIGDGDNHLPLAAD